MGKFKERNEIYFDGKIKAELELVRERVLKKDRDWVICVDGREGVGKSVFAQQIAKFLDPSFSLDNIAFTAEDFIKKIKDPKRKKGDCIVLDEALAAASARASLSEANKSIMSVAAEMRQMNLFIIIVLPSFFDLDKNLALWRCTALFHLYFGENESRNYVVFDEWAKKELYLSGKKTYDYSKVRPTFGPAHFLNQYTVNEQEYRQKKSEAFKKRTVSFRARQWMLQRNTLIRFIYSKRGITYQDINELFKLEGADTLEPGMYSKIMEEGRIIDEEVL